MATQKEKLAHALKRLARSKSIPARFRKEGIKGQKMAPCNCPVANWLKKQGFKINVVSTNCVYLQHNVYVKTPLKVAQFIDDFDLMNYYPELVG